MHILHDFEATCLISYKNIVSSAVVFTFPSITLKNTIYSVVLVFATSLKKIPVFILKFLN